MESRGVPVDLVCTSVHAEPGDTARIGTFDVARSGTVGTDPAAVRTVRTVGARRWEAVLDAALKATADDVAATLEAPGDAVAAALAEGVQRAAQAGQWAAVEALARELEARRRDRAGVTDLASARSRRGR